MIEDKLADLLQTAVQKLFGIHVKTDTVQITRPAKKEHGDLASNIAFIISKEAEISPKEAAKKIADEIAKEADIRKSEAVNGFVNIFLSKERFIEVLKEILAVGTNYASSERLKGQKIQVEFISANPTGPLTLANGRGGFGGDVLANVFAKAGAKVEREYYVNDGGNQVRILGDSILAAAAKKNPALKSLSMGLRFRQGDNEIPKPTEEIYKGEYIEEWVNKNGKTIEKQKDDAFALGQIAAADILEKYIKPSVKKMDIKFDNWFSEKEMIEVGEVEQMIKKLEEYKLTEEKDGALWFKSEKFGDEKDRVLVKSDGEKTYFANDVAYHFDKLYKRKFTKIVDFWGADHHGYVGRMLAAVDAMNCPNALDIVIFQMVRLIKDGKEFKMSKRKGTYITFDELLEMIGGPVSEASDVARFFFLSRSFNTHMDFDLDLAKERSEKNPVYYVKYANARIHGILANAKKQMANDKPKLCLLGEPEELELIDKFSELPAMIDTIILSHDYPVHYLTFYAIEVAKKFHKFYDKCQVIDEKNPKLSAARLELVQATAIVLEIVGKQLIGIKLPKSM